MAVGEIGVGENANVGEAGTVVEVGVDCTGVNVAEGGTDVGVDGNDTGVDVNICVGTFVRVGVEVGGHAGVFVETTWVGDGIAPKNSSAPIS